MIVFPNIPIASDRFMPMPPACGSHAILERLEKNGLLNAHLLNWAKKAAAART